MSSDDVRRQARYRARQDGDTIAVAELETARIAIWVQKRLAEAPPLNEDQLARLRALFRPTREPAS